MRHLLSLRQPARRLGNALVLLAGLAAGLPATAQVAAAASVPAAASAPAAALPGGGPRCRFAVPAGWDARQARWIGDCRDGRAQGPGVLRLLQGNRVKEAFYGRLQAGVPVLGAVEIDGGWRAGRFDATGVASIDGDRNTLIQAFEAAAEAARRAAQHYQAASNPASARFYRQKAEQLAKQID
jgi:hypothetical protein